MVERGLDRIGMMVVSIPEVLDTLKRNHNQYWLGIMKIFNAPCSTKDLRRSLTVSSLSS
jgi:hypothetical protein